MLVRRGWLIHAPLWLLVAGGLWWLAEVLGWPEGLANVIKVFACLVLLVLLVVLWHSLVFATRRGFWLPGQGAGRWVDVIDRHDLIVILRISSSWGSPHIVDFDRLSGWSWAARVLDDHLPGELPGPAAAVPHPEFVTRVEAWADRLLQALVARRALPAFVRGWVLPDGDLSGHALQIDFEPTAGGAEVRLLVNDSSELPIIKVDGTFWAADRGDDEFEAGDYEQRLLDEAASVLAAVLDDAQRTPLPAWRITTPDGQAHDFLPRTVDY